MQYDDPDGTELASVANEMFGAITGSAVQAGVVHGGIHLHPGCAHSDLTPTFDVWCNRNGDDETMSVSFTRRPEPPAAQAMTNHDSPTSLGP